MMQHLTIHPEQAMRPMMKYLISILMDSPLYMKLAVKERLRLLKYLADKYWQLLSR